jgi:hypothetical protein
MPITTYAAVATIRQTQDPDICEALASLMRPPLVKEVHVAVQAHWWSHTRWQTCYSVLWPLGDTLLGPEWQIVNFYRDDAGASINTVVPKEVVLAYLYGCTTRGS